MSAIDNIPNPTTYCFGCNKTVKCIIAQVKIEELMLIICACEECMPYYVAKFESLNKTISDTEKKPDL
jgi:hypothetical protein